MHSLDALADPTRRKIVFMLSKREMAASAIAKKFAMSAPAISQHLNVLKGAGWVKKRVEAQKRIYRLDPKGVKAAEKWLSSLAKVNRKKPKRKKPSAKKTTRKRRK